MSAPEHPSRDARPGASPDDLPPLRDVIRKHGLRAKKSLGQNFLLDLNLTRRIARLAGNLENRTVVEIGPGPGGLTRALLLEGARHVIAIERDDRCLEALSEINERYPGRLKIHSSDATAIDWVAIADEARQFQGVDGDKTAASLKPIIAANLPYGIATKLLVTWLESEPWPPWYDMMVLMFQKEVAERIVAKPGSKSYGRLAVIAQWRTEASLALTLKPEAFTPPPKVASAVVVFKPRENPNPACRADVLSRITAAAFGQRRKMLRQSLKPLYREPEILLQKIGIAPDLRAEDLTVNDFARLARELQN